MRKVIIKPMPDDAWPDVVQIYEARIATGNATFEKQAPEWEVWDKNHRKDCRLVAKIEGRW